MFLRLARKQIKMNFSTKKIEYKIGIDFGSTNTCVSVIENKKVKIIENSEGQRLTPSFISFSKDGECSIGNTAKR